MKAIKNITERLGKILNGHNFYLLHPEMYPLFTLLYNLYRRSAEDIFTWEEEVEGTIVPLWNYCQIFKKRIEFTANTGLEDRAYYRKKRIIELLRDIDRCLFFGLRDEIDVSYRTSGGLQEFIPSIRMPNFTTALPELAVSWEPNPILFCSSATLADILNRYPNRQQDRAVTYNILIHDVTVNRDWETRTIHLIKHPIFRDTEVFKVYIGDLVFRYKTDLYLETDISPERDEAGCVCGLEVHNCLRHARYAIG